MRINLQAGLCSLCFTIGLLACQREANDPGIENPPTIAGDANLVGAQRVTARGCLTGRGDEFVLTELERGTPERRAEASELARGTAPQPTTVTYRLIGDSDQLRPLLGQRVEVIGPAEPEKVVDMRGTGQATGSASSGAATTGMRAQVDTLQTARIEIHDLRVEAVNAIGDPCLAQ
jgi:hypothetical protein